MGPFGAAWSLLKEDEEDELDDYQPGPDGLSEYDKANMDEHGNLPNSAAYHGVSDEEAERYSREFDEASKRSDAEDEWADKHFAGQHDFEAALPEIRMGNEESSVDEYNLPNEMSLWEQSMQDPKLASEPFDAAWALLKSYTSSPATPDGKIVPSFQGQQPQDSLAVAMREPQEGDSDFDDYDDYAYENWAHISDNEKKKLYDRTLPAAQYIFEDRPTPEDARGEVGHAANFSTAQRLDEEAKRMGTDQLYAQTGFVPGDSQFTSYGQ